MERIICTYEELRPLHALFTSVKKVKLRLTGLSINENESFARELNKELNECGCQAGKYFIVYSLLGGLICFFLKVPPFSGPLAWSLLVLSGITFFAAVSGKLLRILYAKVKIKKIIRRINTSQMRKS